MSEHYFIGIKTSEEISKKLMEWQHSLKKTMNYKVWTDKEDMHITLKFLGSCSDDKIKEYVHELQSKQWPPGFTLTIGPAGSFGEEKRPRVFYADVEKAPSLVEMKKQVETVGEELGFPRENRTYRPHVTLAKKQAEGASPLSTSPKFSIFHQSYHMPVDSFSIFRIHPQQKPKYEEIATIKCSKRG
ncbi:2'-5' RNA ligase [Halobacillus karajensis]|uniref:RNA 2',3'-cyclic phosphodiesterase n=1 Tax=Halobacillus karajensis TaxID=195088 RepID=A0A024P774_9BACI|nr:RNA 2',3'-cyclic phosphodiesterase [Halobacillus karajensis]CDQ18346.1 2'-5'-RNA ligase [Halobacillus karajensis]CDQ24700.1 2'-5'-RNA ligase [Halobacillus karajensis]CDQ29054.1 2'-5'-RNA ligase [Halobacillus karajensis]SEI06681.1 2'-5' RNA ligase [Halobacillus karajensis]